MIRRFLAAAMLVVVMMLGSGCASGGGWQGQTRSVVVALEQSWTIAMTGLGALYKSGRLTTDQRDEAILWGNRARDALRVMAAAADAGNRPEFDRGRVLYEDAIKEVARISGGGS